MAKNSKTWKNRKALGLCVYCGKEPRPGRNTCAPCGVKDSAASVEFARQRLVKGLCACGNPVRDGHTICLDCTRRKSFQPQYRTTYQRWRRGGLCLTCGAGRAANRSQCRPCLDQNVTIDKARRERNLAAGLCISCGRVAPQQGITRCGDCARRHKENSDRAVVKTRAYTSCAECGRRRRPSALSSECIACENSNGKFQNPTLRQIVYAHYGSKCTCCGETDKHFLSIDHIHNDGWKDRKERGSKGMYALIAELGFPDTFQILCYNCNMAKGHYGGTCPHQWPENLN